MRPRRRRRARGQALVELALILPLLLLLMLGGYDIANSFGSQGEVIQEASTGLQTATLSVNADLGQAVRQASPDGSVPADGWGLASAAATGATAENDCTGYSQHCGDPDGCVDGSPFWTTTFDDIVPVACFAVRTCLVTPVDCDPNSVSPAVWTAWSGPSSRPDAVLSGGVLSAGVIDVRVTRRISPLFPAFSMLANSVNVTEDVYGVGGWSPYDNVGITDPALPEAGNYDLAGASYEGDCPVSTPTCTSSLASSGLSPGTVLMVQGTAVTWPEVAPGVPDNLVANDQTIAMWAQGAQIAILGSATQADQTQTVTVTYSDGTTAEDQLALSDWTSTTPPAGDQVVVGSVAQDEANGSPGPATGSVFSTTIPLDPTKWVTSISFPPLQASNYLGFIPTPAGDVTNTAYDVGGVDFEPYPEPSSGNNTLGWAWGQCTAYVAYAAPWVNGNVHGNADEWLTTTTLPISDIPAVGDVVVFGPGQSGADAVAGHVAVVVAVGNTGFTIEEGNGTAGLDQVDLRNINDGPVTSAAVHVFALAVGPVAS